jgi:ornithine decarboxylase
MIPVRLRGAAADAFHRYGVRHFLVDQLSGLDDLAHEVPVADCVVFARMAVHHGSAAFDLSSKFGARAADVPDLLRAISRAGAEPGLAFNVGSLVSDPGAYVQGLKAARSVLEALDFEVAWMDIGGGFPAERGAVPAPPLTQYFDMIRQALSQLPLATGAQVLGEPGRALAAPGVSLLLEVLARKESSIYLNDGVYGALWELRFYEDSSWLRVDVWRDGAPVAADSTELESFTVFGPTCDSVDVLPSALRLPATLQRGDYLHIHGMGAYSLAGRTRFNGHYSEDLVQIND